MATAAARAFAEVEDANVEVLLPDLVEMFFAEVAVEYGVVLVRCGQDLGDAKGPVAKSYVTCRNRRTTAPSAFWLAMFVKRFHPTELYHYAIGMARNRPRPFLKNTCISTDLSRRTQIFLRRLDPRVGSRHI